MKIALIILLWLAMLGVVSAPLIAVLSCRPLHNARRIPARSADL